MSKPRWDRQERQLAEAHGAQRTPQSGAGIRKGDVIGRMFNVSCKSTIRTQFALKIVDVAKMTADARIEDRIPVMQIDFERSDDKLAVLRWPDFEELLEAAGRKL